LRMWFAGLGALVDRRQTHLGHQPTDTMAPNTPAIAAQMPCHLKLILDPRQDVRIISASTIFCLSGVLEIASRITPTVLKTGRSGIFLEKSTSSRIICRTSPAIFYEASGG
jgi:hypothetical protein